MPRLAIVAIGDYRESDRETYLDTLFRLQIVAGRYEEAIRSIEELRALRATSASRQLRIGPLQYEIYARAKILARDNHLSFGAAFARAFHDTVDHLDNPDSALVLRALNVQQYGGLSLIVDLSALRDTLNKDLAKQKDKPSISLDNALDLVHAYQVEETYRDITPFVAQLVAEDDRRRYIVDPEVAVKTPDGAVVCALVVRPRTAAGPLATLTEFSIYADLASSMSEARRDAAHGYASVKGFSRGKLCSPGQAVPIEHDGADADALIAWIIRQPWSDGRVGMYGASYDGFTTWAAAKHRPKALKALMTAVTMAPGIDSPMEGNIAENFDYYWPFYVASNKTLDGEAFEDRAHWQKLLRNWYVSGRAYRDIPVIDGKPNPIWNRWVAHPSDDAYWQSAIPVGREFGQIDIPTLTTTGYYDGGQIGALHYFLEHNKYRPHGDDYLVIGPYDHGSGNRGTVNVMADDVGVLDGYRFDPAAHVDFGDLRYQWFDHVLKGGPKPAILKDHVNYEVMGANTWRHAPSIAAMSAPVTNFYLGAAPSGNTYSLRTAKPSGGGSSIVQTIDFSNRKDADRVAPGGGIVDSAIDTLNGLEFVSEPIAKPVELSGLFNGHLDFITNKRDFDFAVQLYERTADGKFIQLSWYIARASYIADRTRRQLLAPNRRQTLDFTNGRLTSRRFAAGSRLVVVLSILKESDLEINYGSGKEVSRETIADAGPPLTVRWLDDSFIGVPIHATERSSQGE